MVRRKGESRTSKIFWRIAISAVGVALIAMAFVNISLFIFGERTTAQVNKRRFGGADNNYSADSRYEWEVDYTFKAEDGKSYSGHTRRRGSDFGVKVENTVYYFRAAPFINSLEGESEPSTGQLILVILGAFLLFVMNRKKKNKRKHKASKTDGEVYAPSFNDYDDSVEEVFYEEE